MLRWEYNIPIPFIQIMNNIKERKEKRKRNLFGIEDSDEGTGK